jgi:hypothetical protein
MREHTFDNRIENNIPTLVQKLLAVLISLRADLNLSLHLEPRMLQFLIRVCACSRVRELFLFLFKYSFPAVKRPDCALRQMDTRNPVSPER